MNNSLNVIPTAQCASYIEAWAAQAGGMKSPILCDVDLNGDNRGDATMTYWRDACGGVPQNIYIDQGHVIYKRVCGGELSATTIINNITPELNAMTCE